MQSHAFQSSLLPLVLLELRPYSRLALHARVTKVAVVPAFLCVLVFSLPFETAPPSHLPINYACDEVFERLPLISVPRWLAGLFAAEPFGTFLLVCFVVLFSFSSALFSFLRLLRRRV